MASRTRPAIPTSRTGRGRCSTATARRSPTATARSTRRLDAVADIRMIETLSPDRPLGVDFYHRAWGRQAGVGLKVWSYGRPIPLSEARAGAENMGVKVVDEQTYQVATADGPGIWFHDMTLERADAAPSISLP